MRRHTDELTQLLDRAAQLDDAMPKVELLQQAINIADTRRDEERGYQVRIALMEVTLHLGRADILMVAFAWCLSKAEANPQQFDYVELLWRFRWAIVNMPSFPNIPRQQIEEAIADMARRYKAAGAAMRAVHLLRWKVAMSMLDFPMAAAARRAWSRSAPGWLADDLDTESVTQLKYLLLRERWEEAIEAADDYITGARTRLSFEDSVLSWLLVPLLRVNRPADAMRCHQRCFRLMKQNVALVVIGSNNMEFLALTHNFTRASKILERHLAFCLTSDAEDQFEFFMAIVTFMRMLQRTDRPTIRLNLDPSCLGYQPSGVYDAATMERIYLEQLTNIADQYDARNGNREHRRLIDRSREVLSFAQPFPVQ